MNKKLFVTSIVILFIGLAFAPSIHANISKERELVEITTEVCGLPGQKPQTIKLSQEDADALDRLFEEIKLKLDNVESREEGIEIFNEAIVELDKYGLLGEMNVKQAQRLVTERYEASRLIRFADRLFQSCQINGIVNSNCLIAGSTGATYFVGLGGRLFYLLFEFFLQVQEKDHSILAAFLAWILSSYIPLYSFLMIYTVLVNPLPIVNMIGFGITSDNPYDPVHLPAQGWIFTQGLNGIQRQDGSFWGSLPMNPIQWEHYDIFPGVLDFSGIKISGFFYLGYARLVKIGEVEQRSS